MKTEDSESAESTDDQDWPVAEDPETPSPKEVLVIGEERIPDEAGYGHGV